MQTIGELFDLSGKIAVVTGAGSGLGVAFATALSSAGASVVCAGRRLDRLEQTVSSLTAGGAAAVAVQLDVTDDAAVARAMRETRQHFGGIDILVNNAGIASVGPPEDMLRSDWQPVIDVNLTGVFTCAREAARCMIESKQGGSIINIASILGAVASEPSPSAAYAATKGAVINLTRDLAVHWAPHGIRVNAIGPAYFPSEMTGPILDDPEIVAEIEHRTPLGRLGRLDELAGPVIFLASNASSYITGQTLFVDGGWTSW